MRGRSKEAHWSVLDTRSSLLCVRMFGLSVTMIGSIAFVWIVQASWSDLS
jgi:hypothetical protein